MSVFLDTMNIVSIAIILSVTVELGRLTLLDWRSITIAVFRFIVSFTSRK